MQGKVPEHGCTVQGSESMLQAVRELVEAEHRRAAAADTMAAAESLVRGDGEGLLQRIVAYFQELFSVPQMEGVLTAMSQVAPHQLNTQMSKDCSTMISALFWHNFSIPMSSLGTSPSEVLLDC